MKKLIFFLSLAVTPLFAQEILSLRQRANVIDQIQKERINKLLPKLMNEQDRKEVMEYIDVQIVIETEFAE